ncbi:arylsulfatase B-like isoform X1 [Dreissena polymorpha]|uniref:arylsulfatase B-like isoform X1 n=1 Tax=Dreissena polymorpha TaxID=45954 RepID=UPI0022650342|nr:arylsulfatase B-like isoform X1 [Dreissena polymorpha]XP_052248927.1 arylsulfatase B-like isoform X1 [Dreissena polymorpha]
MLFVTLTLLTLLPYVTCKPPHIIFIVADDLGWNDVGWHNDAMYTPNLDKLASNGVILNSTYVQPVCSPSRNCFMTGYYPFHTGLQVPESYERIYANISTKSRRTYCGMISALDEAVGNITSALRSRGFMDNALLVFTTDNGGPSYTAANNLPLRGAKTTLWEGGTKGVAFVYSDTLLKKTKYTNTEMMHAVDWFPTLLTLAGGKPDAGMDGVNQWATVSNGAPSARTEFVYNIDEIDKNAAIRVGQYKLIEGSPGAFNGWTPLPPMLETVVNEMFPPYQLFDIDADPTEHFDIADQHPDVVKRLQDRINFHRTTAVPANYPLPDPASNPKHFGGNWSPGWC